MAETPIFNITEEQRHAFDEDGALVLHGVIDGDWLARLSDAIERDIAAPGPFYHGYEPEDGKGHFHGNLRIWENDPAFREFCFSSTLPAVAQQFFGSKHINLLYDQLFVKEPNTINRTRWHNDQPYWPVRGRQVISFWLSPDPVTTESGALEFVRGSHKWDRWFQPERFGEIKTEDNAQYEINPDYEKIPDIEAARQDYDIITWDLAPGDVYVFHGMTVHGAAGNQRQDLRRRGYTVRYLGDDTTYEDRPGISKPVADPSLENGDAMNSAVYPRVL